MEVVYDPENLKIYMEAAEGVDTGPSDPIDRFPASCNGVRGRCDQRRRTCLRTAVMEHIDLPVYIPETPHASFRPDTFAEENLKTIKEYNEEDCRRDAVSKV